jgi:hypothetical protein
MSPKTRATIEDLYKIEGKAELVNGEIVEMPPSGDEPSATPSAEPPESGGMGVSAAQGTGVGVVRRWGVPDAWRRPFDAIENRRHGI